MKILFDENIPYARELFSSLGETKAVPGRQIPIDELHDADMLIVRSVTEVNESLLAGKKIQFVGTATAGIDHIDEEWLTRAGISFSSAPGCNAVAVAEYVLSSLLILSERDNFMLKDRIIGIVGLGNVGDQLKKRFEALNIHTIICDPPRADKGDGGNFYSLKELIAQCDVLTFHTPLYKKGQYKSLHLADEEMISNLKPGTILINTCRGPVIDNDALLKCLESKQKLSVILDVWESEPDLNLALLEKVDIATAHIAGYSLEGRARGTIQVFEASSRFIGKPKKVMLNTLVPIPKFSCVKISGPVDQLSLKKLVHLVYDVRRDDSLLRRVAKIPGGFDKLRKCYPERREWSSLQVICDEVNTARLLTKLGFNAIFYSKC